jgi:hypothetical protein
MAFEDIIDSVEEKTSKHRDRLIAIYIGVLAVLLAICSVGADNATKGAMAHNIEAADAWTFFQAKNIRRNDIHLQIDSLELRLTTEPDLAPAARSAIEEKIKGYKDHEARLSSDPETGEGLKELVVKGKALEAKRDLAMRRDPYFDYGQALLQIAIVLASVAIITGGSSLLILSILLAGAGSLFTLNGFTLAYALPYLG